MNSALTIQREYMQRYDTTNLLEARWRKWSAIEAEVLDEVAKRITKQGTMPTYTLKQFKHALHNVATIPVAA